ncbi:hypothetical protein QBC44DRAFT_392361, partial [Cladorrhinum sp. PSN332]
MISRQIALLLSAVLATTPQYTAAQILSCADLECPVEPGTTNADCVVAGEDLGAIGVADVPTNISSLTGLSWTKDTQSSPLGASSTRTFTQLLYFAAGFNPDNTGICALFFNSVSENVRFNEALGDRTASEGTCQQALTDTCVNALIRRANSVNLQGVVSTEAACQSLQSEFENNLDPECAGAATGSQWAGITVQALTGATAPEPISSSQNSSSNCWPTLPKSNDLTLVETVNTTVSCRLPTAQLTCVKVVDSTTASNATLNPGNGPDSEGGFRLAGSGALAVWAGTTSVLISALL